MVMREVECCLISESPRVGGEVTATDDDGDDVEPLYATQEVEMDFADSDLALATVPGRNFDPKSRSFTIEELKPHPIVKKRRKVSTC